MADGDQYFSIPTILSAMAAAAEVIEGSPTYVFGYTGLVAGSAKVWNSYYAPTARADIYANGIKSLECVRRTAIRVTDLDKSFSVAGGTPAKLTDIFALAAQETKSQPTVGPAIDQLASQAIQASLQVNDATDQVLWKVSFAQRHAGTPPDFATIAAQLKQSVTSGEQQRQATAAAVAPGAVPARPGASQTPNYDFIQTMPSLTSAISTLKADLDTCVAVAGS
jgi:hypothetical protein